MYQKYIIFSSILLCGWALDDPRVARILDYQLEQNPSGHYFFRFESSDGIIREEEGNVLDENSPDSPVIVKGSYSYADETGKVYTVRYIADENGFHPEGEHLKAPSFVINPSPRPQLRPQFIYPSSTPRPEITTPTRIQIPLESRTSSTTAKPYTELDSKLQRDIVNLLSNGDGRGFSIAAVNSI